MSRKQLVGITGQRVQADGGSEVLVEGQEVWEEWTGQTVENTEWRGKAKGLSAVEGNGAGNNEKWMEEGYGARLDKVYDRG